MRALPGLGSDEEPEADQVRSPKQQSASMASIKKAIATTPWRHTNLAVVGTKRAAECAKYIAALRAAGDEPRPLTELDE